MSKPEGGLSPRYRDAKIAFVSAATVALAACASTTFNSTWKAPDARPLNFAGQKVAALVISTNEASRLGAEGALARELTAHGVEGIAAYNLIPPNESRDKEKAKALFSAAGVVGVVAMRVVGHHQEISSSPSMGYWGAPYYGSFWGGSGYYGHGWADVYDPGYLRTDTILSVETLVYDMKADKLVWAGRSQTTNPSKVETLIKELVAGAANEMKKQGLIRSK
jgi:hypothetical protein